MNKYKLRKNTLGTYITYFLEKRGVSSNYDKIILKKKQLPYMALFSGSKTTCDLAGLLGQSLLFRANLFL